MRKLRLALAALMAAGLLAVGAGGAHATRLSVSEQGFSMIWNTVFRISDTGGTAECSVTLAGSLHSRTIVKVRSVLIGYITGATMAGCTGASAGFLRETLPWHVRYEGFNGTLPNITSVRVEVTEAGIWLRTGFFVSCLARSSASRPLKMLLHNSGGRLTTVQLVESPITYQESVGCTGLALTPRSAGTGEIYIAGGGTRILLTLI